MALPGTTGELESIVTAALGAERPEIARTIVNGIKELSRSSRINAVTGSPDIRQLIKDVPEIEREGERQSKTGSEQIYILMIDIDKFGDFNKRYGEHVGNDVLKAVDGIISSTFRGDDAIFALASKYKGYHLHGEEMMAVYTCRSREDALKVAERVRLGVEERSVKETGYKVTISLGVTNLRAGIEEFAAAQQRADKYMQMAKKEGRNRVYCGEEDPLFLYKEEFYAPGRADAAMKGIADAITNVKGAIGRMATAIYTTAAISDKGNKNVYKN